MKRILCVFTVLAALASCTRDPRPQLSTEEVNDLKIIVTPGEVSNTYMFRSSRTDVICFWNLGNGSSADGVNSVMGEYPFAGTYTVKLTAYGDTGQTNNVSVKIVVTEDNLFLLNDPMYTWIAGEIGGEGKTWMMDSGRQGHINLLNPNNYSDSWYSCGPDGKAGCEMYDDEATFYLSSEKGQAFEYVNGGRSCTINNATAIDEFMKDGAWGSLSYSKAATNDNIVVCTPPSGMKWSLNNVGGRYYITFPGTTSGHGGYLFYFSGWSTTYEVRAISETHMMVYALASLSGSTSLRQLLLRTKDTQTGNEPVEWLWSHQ
ncbi:MAG: hypothetical protein PUC72_01920 [Bacteroidales bacterium]|nr:hypothetical protein [Bacteroidales bacterium]